MGSGVSVEAYPGIDKEAVMRELEARFSEVRGLTFKDVLNIEWCSKGVPEERLAEIRKFLEEKLRENVAALKVECSLREMPDAMDQIIFQKEKWPVILDEMGQASRFLRYQRGKFLSADNPVEMIPENLRKLLVGALQHGLQLVIEIKKGMDGLEKLEKAFDPKTFPREILNKENLFKPETWGKLLRPKEKGEPGPDVFQPKDNFRFVLVVHEEETASRLALVFGLGMVVVTETSVHGSLTMKPEDEIAAAFGAKDIERDSKKLVEAAFDGDWDIIQSEIDKGYSVNSIDLHEHSALSEAACQGHLEICEKLVELGADPNVCNDVGRSPLWRASYNGHVETIKFLLSKGADPRLAAGLEMPHEVAKSYDARVIFENWNIKETLVMLKERGAEEERRLEERLKTAAERDTFAREKIRAELIEMAMENKLRELKSRLQELADEALAHNERPRGNAEVRDERGMTLLLIAASKGYFDLVEFLLSKFQDFDSELDNVERKVFFSNINAREAKGWNACALAVFHGHKRTLQLLLKKGCNPYVKNAYNKNAFDFAQDEKDAARNVMTDRSEIRAVLENWENEECPEKATSRREQAKRIASQKRFSSRLLSPSSPKNMPGDGDMKKKKKKKKTTKKKP